MQYTYLTVLAFAAAAVAAPTLETRQSAVAPPPPPTIPFEGATCSVPQTVTGSPPFGAAFPTASQIGAILGPQLRMAIGADTLNDIDILAEDVCVGADQDPQDPTGPCDDFFNTLFDLSQHEDKAAANKYSCLLAVLCIAPTKPSNPGLCQKVLAGADCVANRIIGDKGNAAECGPKYYPNSK